MKCLKSFSLKLTTRMGYQISILGILVGLVISCKPAAPRRSSASSKISNVELLINFAVEMFQVDSTLTFIKDHRRR
jgi:hypothetical protein